MSTDKENPLKISWEEASNYILKIGLATKDDIKSCEKSDYMVNLKLKDILWLIAQTMQARDNNIITATIEWFNNNAANFIDVYDDGNKTFEYFEDAYKSFINSYTYQNTKSLKNEILPKNNNPI